jgi:photosystem II stability/assembly factor-like uncharacterized protein
MTLKMSVMAASLMLAACDVAYASLAPVDQVHFRSIGPALPEGRATAVVGSNKNALLYYAGTAGGGAWKSTDGGASWQNITDPLHVASIGAIAVSAANDDDVWIGAGETNPRNDVIPERGLYHSNDGGLSWKTIPFPGGEGISRILLDPKNPKHVVIGVLGNAFGTSGDRGVYASFDGGATFSKTLFTTNQTGVSDMAMDPSNPNVIYAGMWHFMRRPWAMLSGGTGDDGLYRSLDGGRTFARVSGGGFPAAPLGRVGVAIAPSDPKRVYAMVESRNGLLWRSDDSGVSWKMTSKDALADNRPFYFTHVRVSPSNENAVYGLSVLLAASYNGGTKFSVAALGVHPDLHDMWISADGERMALAGDGGIAVSTNGGQNWSNAGNLPVAQVYRVGLSNATPYYICGGLQDNDGFCGPAFSGEPGIANRDWINAVQGDGEWVVPDPLNPRVVWGDYQNGEIQRYDMLTHDNRNLRPYRGTANDDFVLKNARYRFNWESPIAFAAYDPHIALFGGNVLFRTSDRGKTWTVISPDLTRNDKSKQTGDTGSVTRDVSSAENYGTLMDIETSPLRNGEIWTGSDDGFAYLTLDGGKHWKNVTPPALPIDSVIETVAVSSLKDGTAYLSADRHLVDDRAAYLYRTTDFGAHWSKITNGIPAGEWVRSVRPDIHNPNMIFAGTNRGLRISCDAGGTWQPFMGNLPTVEVRDIRFQPQFDDMVIATHGRAIWVMDDMRVIQNSGCSAPTSPLVIGPRQAVQMTAYNPTVWGDYNGFLGAQPSGSGGLLGGLFGNAVSARIYYWLPKEAKARPTIDVYDTKGHRVRQVEGQHEVFNGNDSSTSWLLSNSEGKNEFFYDFSVDGPPQYHSAPFYFLGPDDGPQLPPGHYLLAFHLDGRAYRFPVTLIADPASTTTQAEFERAFNQRRMEYDLLGRVDTMLNSLARVKEDLATQEKAAKAGDVAIARIDSMMAEIEKLVNALTSSPQSFEDAVSKPGQYREDVMNLISQDPLAFASLNLYEQLEADYPDRAASYNALMSKIATLNRTLSVSGLNAVAVPKMAPTKPEKLTPIVSH